ncbi:RNA polymerase sigma-70 factor [Desertivirga brevis]|uniref:RNA polymerase sigma-70 factor n=1 Tax=Desertivirga brevis TaxID=2810310 RepID=UPI0034E236F6
MESNTASLSANVFYNDHAFERMFKEHYKALHAYANVMLRDEDLAEEIVQNVFLKLWERREGLNVEISVKAYLYKMIHNACLNYFKHNKTKAKYEDYAVHSMAGESNKASQRLELKELEQKIGEALNELPQQCRVIFQMSRFEELKYKEIADQLGLSIKTVENQMGKALKIMRTKLVDFLPLLLLWLFNRLL